MKTLITVIATIITIACLQAVYLEVTDHYWNVGWNVGWGVGYDKGKEAGDFICESEKE